MLALAFYIATYVDVQPSSTNAATALIAQYREASRGEEGNLGVDVVQEIGRPNRFVIVEAWKDQASFEAHDKGANTTQFRTKLKAVHNSPYDLRAHSGFAIDPRTASPGRDTLSIVTHIDVPPPRREEAEVLLKRLAEDSRKDDGNLRYDVFQQAFGRTNHFTVFSVWKDRKAFDAHEAQPHTRQFREALGPMLGALYDERLYK
jgi:quinol monooxygenase YgiN